MAEKKSFEKIVGIMKGGKSKEELIIEGVTPKFDPSYFKNIDLLFRAPMPGRISIPIAVNSSASTWSSIRRGRWLGYGRGR